MKILLICNDFYHPGKVVSQGLSFLREEGHRLDVISDAADFKPEMLGQYDVAVLSKSNEISAENRNPWETPEVQHEFLKNVDNGGGLLALHSGLVGYERNDDLGRLIGCRFTHHPEQCPVTIRPLKKHAITEGVSECTETDEHYFIELFADDADILMHSVSSHGEVPACYTRMQGNGRVCVFTPGHNLAVFNNPTVQQIMRNVIKWLGTKE